eukprot:m.199897 g.199897  ORF g.199897 m.199897 type:complete len:103 (-) comp32754_c0_seq1:80-388(-)
MAKSQGDVDCLYISHSNKKHQLKDTPTMVVAVGALLKENEMDSRAILIVYSTNTSLVLSLFSIPSPCPSTALPLSLYPSLPLPLYSPSFSSSLSLSPPSLSL